MFEKPERKEDDSLPGDQAISETTTTKQKKRKVSKKAVKVIVPFEDDNMKEFHLWDWLFDKVNISVEAEPDWINRNEIYIITGPALDMKKLVEFLSENKYLYYLTKK